MNAAGGTARRSPQSELPLFAPEAEDVTAAEAAQTASDRAFANELRAALAGLEPDSLSPRAALDAIYKLRELLAKHS